ncbi:WXG100 family type VII secretion target [Actinokineospora iranica]|uniref:WXG100 family type VII secretion target n=1 Tax=Actinokineospora iranica TaxID=1271860 RepID=A0A1G6QZW6_9PSEU|nr:hypothetical protein [Actinokineospora iranica]SDC97892.1 hypothetical protein SAMN05216174_10664 [Actinokineospora iranica]
MTAGGFSIEPDVAARAATKLGSAADQLAAVGKTLADALAAEGACWGNDDSGQEFAKDYVPGSDDTVKAFTSLVDGLRGLQSGVTDAVAAYGNVDDTNRHGLDAQES